MSMLHCSSELMATNNKRYTELLCISAQVFQLDAGSWRELTKDFVLIHVYYDSFSNLTKLIAADGVKLIIKDLILSSCLTLTRPTKKFVHFVSSVYGRSEMYGFGVRKAEDAALFINQVNRLSRKLTQLFTSNDKMNTSRHSLSSAVYPTVLPSSVQSFHSVDMDQSLEMAWKVPLRDYSPPKYINDDESVKAAFQELTLSDDDFTDTAVPSVLGALDDVYRTPTKQYLKDNRIKYEGEKEESVVVGEGI